jgi:hypothetical protein
LAPQECKEKNRARRLPLRVVFISHGDDDASEEHHLEWSRLRGDTWNSLHPGRRSESLEFYCLFLVARTARSLRLKEWRTLFSAVRTRSLVLFASAAANEWWQETCPRGALRACRVALCFSAEMRFVAKSRSNK